MLSVAGAFLKHVSEQTEMESIVLKYPIRTIDGIVSWASLRASQSCAETWRLLLTTGLDIIEVGVVLENAHSIRSVLQEGIICPVTDGTPIDAYFNPGPGLGTLIGYQNPVSVPTNYEVRGGSFIENEL